MQSIEDHYSVILECPAPHRLFAINLHCMDEIPLSSRSETAETGINKA